MVSWLAAVEQHVTLGGIIALCGFAVHQLKIWTRLKDRVNTLWFHHCDEKGEPYTPLENGKH